VNENPPDPAAAGLATLVADDVAPTGEPIPDGRVSRARDLVLGNGGLHYVAEYGVGFRYFEVDVLRALDSPGRNDAGAQRRRVLCRKIGRKISFQTARHLNEWLAPLETGPLIRTVIRTRGGAIYCDRIVPGQYLVGATVPRTASASHLLRHDPSFDEVDEALALCVADIRSEILLRAQNLGGWESGRLREELLQAENANRGGEAGAPEQDRGSAQPFQAGDLTHPAAALCRAAVSVRNLHLVALFDEERQIFSIDVLHHDASTAGLVSTLGAVARRERYHEIGAELPAYLREVARTARDVIGGPMVSAVLDVEQGAVFFQRLTVTQYLVGVTLHQSEVATTEGILRRLVDAWPAR